MNLTGSSSQSLAVVLWLLAIVDPIHVQAQQESTAKSGTPPGNLNVDSSRVFTLVTGTGLGHSHGMEAKFASGSLELGAIENAGQLVIDMASFDADTPLARQAVRLEGTSAKWMRKQVNKEMLGDKILDVEDFPIATYDIVSCRAVGIEKATGLASYQLTGNLTLRGETRQVTIPVAVEDTTGWLHVTGKFSFKQSEFGIKPLSKGFGSIGVADELTIIGELWIVPTAESLASIQNLQLRR